MIVSLSQIVVMAFGILIVALSVWGIYAPQKLMAMVAGVMDRDFGLYGAVIGRVLLGSALIFAAVASAFPTVFRVLGWIAILAAVGLMFIGRERLRRFIGWFDRFSPALIRLWLLLGVAFGAFLIYALT